MPTDVAIPGQDFGLDEPIDKITESIVFDHLSAVLSTKCFRNQWSEIIGSCII